jgi:hypothetical protein
MEPFLYEHTDIPEGMTCADYRRMLEPERRPGLLERLRRLTRRLP